jgi:hypothetical protein
MEIVLSVVNVEARSIHDVGDIVTVAGLGFRDVELMPYLMDRDTLATVGHSQKASRCARFDSVPDRLQKHDGMLSIRLILCNTCPCIASGVARDSGVTLEPRTHVGNLENLILVLPRPVMTVQDGLHRFRQEGEMRHARDRTI